MSALIIAKPGHLRDSLQVLLASISPIEKTVQVDDVPSALSLRGQQHPALVLIDSDLSNDELHVAMRQIKAEWPQTRCIVLLDEEGNHEAAKAAEADVVLTKGVLASKFYAMVEAVLAGERIGGCDDLPSC